MKIEWAKDTWLGWDKLDHVTYGALCWMVLGLGVRFGFYGVFFQLVLFVLIALALEAVQYTRYEAWEHEGAPPPRPAQADLPSYRDLVADALGALLGVFLLYLLA